MLMCAGEAPTGLLGGSLCEREIYQKLNLKIIRKFLRVRQSAHLFWSALRAEILQNRFKIKQDLWAVRLKAY